MKPYQAELGQGNSIQASQLEQLKVGMTEKQVLFLLGTPLLTGERPAQRWNYTSFEDNTGYSTLSVIFENGVVSNIIKK